MLPRVTPRCLLVAEAIQSAHVSRVELLLVLCLKVVADISDVEARASALHRQINPIEIAKADIVDRLRYDLRLELDGVLKSWAVTKGPSLTVGEKRLAVRTEDHPIEYLTFEGNIPKGQYGGGSMIVWDRGQWEPECDPQRGLAKGHLAFTLDGARLKGRWHLVRIRPKSGEKTEPWLLMKSDDAFARGTDIGEITDEETTSQFSGRTNEELAAMGEVRKDHAARAGVAKERKIVLLDICKLSGARAGLLPVFLEPSLASPCEKPPSGPKWIHKIKYDGYHMQARIDGRTIRLLTRKGLDWTERFRSIAEALKMLGLGSALIDGEIIVEDASGISSFNGLQADLQAGRIDQFQFIVFDILYCEGFDLTKVVLAERKEPLQQLLTGLPEAPPIRVLASISPWTGPPCWSIPAASALKGSSPNVLICRFVQAVAIIGSKANASSDRSLLSWATSLRR